MRSITLVTLSFVFLSPLAASAQPFGGLGDTKTPFTLSIDPQYPAPYSQATLSAQSNTLDLANAIMTVTIADKKIYQGNIQPVPLILGKAGSVTRIIVDIVSSGTNYTQTISLQPQDVALIAEPVSSSPPLYPGKSLVPTEGSTRVVAVANFRNADGTTLDPAKLSYAWKVDDTKIANSSGIGKSAVLVASPLPYRLRSVSVAITSQDGTLVGGDSLSLSPQEPSVRIYENDPLLGIRFEYALIDTFPITSTESTLYGAPFSLPITNGAPSLQWFLNGSAAQTGNSITLRPTGDGQGNASLSLTASSGSGSIASTYLSLSFGAQKRGNFFGL